MILKRCPFCGGEGYLFQNYSNRYYTWFVMVKCDMCGGQGKSFSSKIAPSDENWDNQACRSAASAWNSRIERRVNNE